jgi:ParB/RepB/Spo0J family partition protein
MSGMKTIATAKKLAREASGAPAQQTAEPPIVEPEKPQADEPDEYHGAIRVTPEEWARMQAETEAARAALEAKRAAQAQFPKPDLKAVIHVDLEDIVVRPRKRALNQENVDRLKESIRTLGLRTPISVRLCTEDREEPYDLVTGAHRYQACLELDWAEIPARIEGGSAIDAELWEVSENLARAELTALERDEHIRAWARLVKAKKRETEEAEKQAKLDLEAKKEVSANLGRNLLPRRRGPRPERESAAVPAAVVRKAARAKPLAISTCRGRTSSAPRKRETSPKRPRSKPRSSA